MVIAVVVVVPLYGTATNCARSDRNGTSNWRAKWRKSRPRFDKIIQMRARTDLSRQWSMMASRQQPGFNGSATWRDRSIGVVGGGDLRGGKERRSARRIIALIERCTISKEFSRVKVAGGRRTGAERRSAAATYEKNKEALVKRSANNGGSGAARSRFLMREKAGSVTARIRILSASRSDRG